MRTVQVGGVAALLRASYMRAAATPAYIADAKVRSELLHGQQPNVWGDGAYQRKGEKIRHKAPLAQDVTSRRATYKQAVDELWRRKERTEATVRSRVEHAFQVMKRQFGLGRVRYRGLEKNANRMFACFALLNPYIPRKLLVPLGP